MEIPNFFKQKLIKQYGDLEYKRILRGYNTNRKTTFRVNRIKSSFEEIKKILDENNILYSNVSWYKDAFIIESDFDIRKLSIYEEGKIYIQSLSSMIPPLIINPKENESILDMCSAPGSKTTMIASISDNKARIVANEKDKIRIERLKYNVQKQGIKNISIIDGDALKLDDYFRFDKILLDAPCSGSGTINASNIKYFSEELVHNSKKLQISLLKKAINLVKIGGEIVYSTCSILKDENEEVLMEVLKDERIELVPIKLDVPALKTKIFGTVCVYPDEIYEGFFVSKLKRVK